MNYLEELTKVYEKISSDTTLVVIFAIGVSVTLIIMLIILVSGNIINELKRRVFSIETINHTKEAEIQKLTREIKVKENIDAEKRKIKKEYEKTKEDLELRESEIVKLQLKQEKLIKTIERLEQELIEADRNYVIALNDLKVAKVRNEELIAQRRVKV